MNEGVLTPEQVADRLQISRFTVVDHLRAGRIRGIKVGRFWRVREKDLEAFVEAEGEELSAEDLAAVRRGLEDIKAGRYVTLEEYEKGRRP